MASPPTTPSLDVARVREQFPILSRMVGGRPLIYLDSAASTQKPRCVIDAIRRYYEETHSNVHRGVHRLSIEATDAFEGAREKVRAFLNAERIAEIIWTRGTTEGLNLVANSWARPHLRAGDEILVSEMEHHSNIVPWQMVAAQTGAQLRVARMAEDGSLPLESVQTALTERTKIVAVTHASNALGTINPIKEITRLAHDAGAVVVIDGAQATAHLPVDVRDIDCDFYAFSGHKVFGPTGIGILYGKHEHLVEMPPYMGGGDMIRTVTFEETTYTDPPHKFEAGTPNIAGAVGLGAAIDFVNDIGLEAIAAHEDLLLHAATDALTAVPGLRILGRAPHKTAVDSFVLQGIHPHDVGTILDRQGLAVRTGHHCAQPVMQKFGVPATTRASFSVYNVLEEVDALVAGLDEVRQILG